MTVQREKRYLPSKPVRDRYRVSDMTIRRWLNDPRMNFPRPVYLGRYRYWDEAELEAWERERARRAENEDLQRGLAR